MPQTGVDKTVSRKLLLFQQIISDKIFEKKHINDIYGFTENFYPK